MGESFVEPYELAYSDLLLISEEIPLHSATSSVKSEEVGRLGMIIEDVMEAIGPTGPGLLTVNGTPNSDHLQGNLLMLSRKLALLTPEARNPILREHGLGSDVALKNPDRSVSSFVMQLELTKASKPGSRDKGPEFTSNDIGGIFRELGAAMVDLGLRLARVCDRAIEGGRILEHTILESSSAKCRLIHYHSSSENPATCQPGSVNQSLWQQWHYDYGIFTVLTAPLFTSPAGEEAGAGWGGHSCLQVLHPGKGGVHPIKVGPGSFIVQVGEAAAVLTEGKLCPTLHSVSRPGEGYRGLSRDTFAVFLQPAWTKTLTFSSDWYERHGRETAADGSFWEIEKTVPPLRSRLRDGMTFADFSRQTTKRYYGGSGFQKFRS